MDPRVNLVPDALLIPPERLLPVDDGRPQPAEILFDLHDARLEEVDGRLLPELLVRHLGELGVARREEAPEVVEPVVHAET